MHSFKKSIGLFLIKTFLLLTLCIIGYSVAIYYFTSKLTEQPEIKANSVLVIDLSKLYSDKPEASDLDTSIKELLAPNTPYKSFYNQIQSIYYASTDPNIKGILLLNNVPSSIVTAQYHELRTALSHFKKSKPIFSYIDSSSFPTYYITSVSNYNVIHPMGMLDLSGFASNQIMAGKLLTNLGIQVQILKSGKYKSAVEPFTLDTISKENREQLESLLTSMWNSSLKDMEPDFWEGYQNDINTISNNKGFLSSKESVEKKLISESTSRIKFNENISSLLDLEYKDINFTPLTTYLTSLSNSDYKDKIALIYIEGTIVHGESSKNKVGHQTMIPIIREIKENDNIKAVVVRVNSPGGSALAADLIYDELKSLSDKKPVVFNFGNYAASGGYWIATSDKTITTSPQTITGSIGVFAILPNIQGFLKNISVGVDTVKTNNYGDISSLTRPKSLIELKKLQNHTDSIYDKFLLNVSNARNITVENVNEIAQGRVWSGEQALPIKLVNNISTLHETILLTASKNNLKEYSIIEYPKPDSYFDSIQNKSLIDLTTLPNINSKYIDFLQSVVDPNKQENIYLIDPNLLNIN